MSHMTPEKLRHIAEAEHNQAAGTLGTVASRALDAAADEIERLQALLLQVVEQRWRLPSIRASLRDEICEELGCGADPHKWDENILRKRNVPKGRENAG